MEDTAELTPATAVEESDPLLQDIAPEPEIGEDSDIPETEGEETPETEEEESLANLSEEDLLKHPAFIAALEKQKKDIEARANESARRREENARKAAQQEEQGKQFEESRQRLRGEVGNRFVSSVTKVVTDLANARAQKWSTLGEGELELDPREVHQVLVPVLQNLTGAVIANGVADGTQIIEAYRKNEYPDYKPDEEDVEALATAKHAGDWRKIMAVNATMMLKADRVQIEKTIRDDERKKVLAEIKARADSNTETKAAAQRTAKPKPSAPTPVAVTPQSEVTAELLNNPIEFQRRFPTKEARQKAIAEFRSRGKVGAR